MTKIYFLDSSKESEIRHHYSFTINILFVYTFCYICFVKNLSLKMDDTIFQETEKIVSKVGKNRNRYINEAVEFYNMLQKRNILSKQLQKESRLVRDESMKILEEFERLENED